MHKCKISRTIKYRLCTQCDADSAANQNTCLAHVTSKKASERHLIYY